VEEDARNGWRNQRITTTFIRPSFEGRTDWGCFRDLVCARFTLGQDAIFGDAARVGAGCAAGSVNTFLKRSDRSNQRSDEAFVRCQTGAASRHRSSAASFAFENATESCRSTFSLRDSTTALILRNRRSSVTSRQI
jgi:hypothetical protein